MTHVAERNPETVSGTQKCSWIHLTVWTVLQDVVEITIVGSYVKTHASSHVLPFCGQAVKPNLIQWCHDDETDKCLLLLGNCPLFVGSPQLLPSHFFNMLTAIGYSNCFFNHPKPAVVTVVVVGGRGRDGLWEKGKWRTELQHVDPWNNQHGKYRSVLHISTE